MKVTTRYPREASPSGNVDQQLAYYNYEFGFLHAP